MRPQWIYTQLFFETLSVPFSTEKETLWNYAMQIYNVIKRPVNRFIFNTVSESGQADAQHAFSNANLWFVNADMNQPS